MAIKKTDTLTPYDLDQAIIALRLNISEVAKDTGVPRTYISEFRNGNRRLLPEHQAKLRDYFESKGVEFVNESEPEAATETEPVAAPPVPVEPPTDPEGIQRVVLAIRHLAIDPGITREQITAILEKIEANDQEAMELLQLKAEAGLFSDWSEATDAMLKGVFGLFAANYVLLRYLQGRPLVMLANPVKYDDIKTVADIFAHLFHEENAALVAAPEPQEPDAEVEEATA